MRSASSIGSGCWSSLARLKEAMLQAADVSRTPVVATHSCCRALCDLRATWTTRSSTCCANRRPAPDHRRARLPPLAGAGPTPSRSTISAITSIMRSGADRDRTRRHRLGFRRRRRLLRLARRLRVSERHRRAAGPRLRRSGDRAALGRQFPPRAAARRGAGRITGSRLAAATLNSLSAPGGGEGRGEVGAERGRCGCE